MTLKVGLSFDDIRILSDLVSSYMDTGMSFTSLDITNIAKDEGCWVRNHWVAEWLRSNAINIAYAHGYLYNQTLIQVDSKRDGITLAYLYHHMDIDTDTYLDRDQNPKSMRRGPASASFGNQQTGGGFTTQDGGQHVTPATTTAKSSPFSPDGWTRQVRQGNGRFGGKK